MLQNIPKYQCMPLFKYENHLVCLHSYSQTQISESNLTCLFGFALFGNFNVIDLVYTFFWFISGTVFEMFLMNLKYGSLGVFRG